METIEATIRYMAPELRGTACSCGGRRDELQRIPRHPLQRSLLFFLPLKRYRCLRCRRKQSVWRGL